jgi:hypothetical protein
MLDHFLCIEVKPCFVVLQLLRYYDIQERRGGCRSPRVNESRRQEVYESQSQFVNESTIQG